MDPFQCIPVHLLEDLLTLIPDLPSLLHLLHASPAVSAVFNHHAVKIVQPILITSTPSSLRYLILLTAQIRSRAPSITNTRNLDELCSKFIEPEAKHSACRSKGGVMTLFPAPRLSDCVANSSGEACPSSISIILRQILATTCHIQHLARQCVEEWTRRIRTANISHLEDPTFRYYYHTIKSPTPYDQHPPGRPYQPPEPGPPTELEECRILYILWRIQVLFELQNAAQQGIFCHWPEYDLHYLQSVRIEEFWSESLIGDVRFEQLRTVVHCLSDLYPGFDSAYSENEHEPTLPILPPRYRGPIQYSFPTAAGDPNAWPERNCEYDLHAWSESMAILDMQVSFRRESPLQFVGHAPFRQYGFAFWDGPRMVKMELLDEFTAGLYTEDDDDWDLNPNSKPKPEPEPEPGMTKWNSYFTWRSLLTEEDEKQLAEFRERVLASEGRIPPYSAMRIAD